MNNFYKKYSGKDDPDLLEEIMENSEVFYPWVNHIGE